MWTWRTMKNVVADQEIHESEVSEEPQQVKEEVKSEQQQFFK